MDEVCLKNITKQIVKKSLFFRVFLCKKIYLYKTSLTRKKKFWKTFFVENFFDQVNFLWKISLTVENFIICRKLAWLWKLSMTVEKLLHCGKVLWLWKSSMTVEKFLDCGKVSWLWKTHFFDRRKNNSSNNFESKC